MKLFCCTNLFEEQTLVDQVHSIQFLISTLKMFCGFTEQRKELNCHHATHVWPWKLVESLVSPFKMELHVLPEVTIAMRFQLEAKLVQSCAYLLLYMHI